jgi:PRTRC genetic system protein B
MNVNLYQSTPSYALQHAVLLYGANPDSVDLVTINSVVQTDAGPIIGEGRGATKAGLLEMLECVKEAVRKPLELLHPNVIALTDDCMVWWEEAGPRRIAFQSKELGSRAAVVPHPALLFVVKGASWYVFALAENKRPTADTALYVAPYFNVWAGGAICSGSTRTPTKTDATNPDAWTKAFFESAFTHPNIHALNQLVLWEHGCFAFWRDMLDGKFTSFPNEVLVSTNVTVQKLIFKLQ